MKAWQEKTAGAFRKAFPGDGRRLVWGEGRTDHPPVMLIGEAPGGQEEEQDRPFVGKAGKNLDEFLQVLGLPREGIYISNVVKVRPTRVSPKGTVSNRPPDRLELAVFSPLLYEEILLVQPLLVVTLGNTALQALTGLGATIGESHGQMTSTTVMAGGVMQDFPVFPLYHPASVIYNRALAETYHSDLLALREAMEEVLEDAAGEN